MAPRLKRIYTRTGDGGSTRLVGGQVVSKGSLTVESYGTVDELCSHIGLLRTLALEIPAVATASESVLRRIQNTLFDLGSLLATPPSHKSFETRLAALTRADDKGPLELLFLEQQIDQWNQKLSSLKTFVLPGGSRLNAQAHLARTVCRRLERVLVRRHEETPLPEFVLGYINRLSDLLFVYARWVAEECEVSEYLWETNQ